MLQKTGQVTLHRVLDTAAILHGSNKEYNDDTYSNIIWDPFNFCKFKFDWAIVVKKARSSKGLFLSDIIFFLWCCCPTRVIATSFLRFLEHTQRRTTVGRTPLDE
jgi:hypothetical protein